MDNRQIVLIADVGLRPVVHIFWRNVEHRSGDLVRRRIDALDGLFVLFSFHGTILMRGDAVSSTSLSRLPTEPRSLATSLASVEVSRSGDLCSVSMDVLARPRMMRAVERTFDDRPERFGAVGRHVSDHLLALAVVDRQMRPRQSYVFAGNPRVA